MALTTKRIIALPSQTDPQEGDYLAIDNLQGGTKKIPVGRIGVEVDDTLTEAGKAADAKAFDDALDEMRSQIEVTGTASGAIASFTDGSDAPMKSCMVTIVPKQSGAGTPSPDNVRQISGWTEVNVIVSPTQEATDGHTTTTPLGRTVYGAEAEIVGGNLTDKMGIVTLDGSSDETYVAGSYGMTFRTSLPNDYKPTANNRELAGLVSNQMTEVAQASTWGTVGTCSVIANTNQLYFKLADDLTDISALRTYLASNPVQIVYPLATPQTYTLTGQEVSTLLGENNVWADAGDVEVVYVRDLNIAINNLLNSNGTRSLGMMMSAPTENTTDEQTDEPAEDDMR